MKTTTNDHVEHSEQKTSCVPAVRIRRIDPIKRSTSLSMGKTPMRHDGTSHAESGGDRVGWIP